jgi:DnaJ-class molecular chaperone
VTLHDALCGVRTSVTTLDGRTLPIDVKSVTPESTKLLLGEGMPNRKVRKLIDYVLLVVLILRNSCTAKVILK